MPSESQVPGTTLFLNGSTLSVALLRLFEAGENCTSDDHRCVLRRPRPDDGRIVVVALTQDQRDALRMAAPILEQLARR